MSSLRKLNGLKFVAQTDVEKIEALDIPKKGSADVVGIRLLALEPNNEFPDVFRDKLQWTSDGCYTKCKGIAKNLVSNYGAIYEPNRALMY